MAKAAAGSHFQSMLKLKVPTWEKNLTYLIANRWSATWLDPWMVTISDPYRWMMPALILLLVLIYLNWQSAMTILLLGGGAAAVSDALNTRVIKKRTDRIRPGKQFADIRSLGIMNHGKQSFPSNHASNTMAFALAFALVYPATAWLSISLALLVGYSRIYCGAHFPLDVLMGWIHGALWVVLFYLIFF